MLRLVEFKKEHIMQIMEKNQREVEASDLAKYDWKKVYSQWDSDGPAWTLFEEEEIVACGGFVLEGWKTGTGWLFLSSLFYKRVLSCYRIIKAKIKEVEEQFNLQRLQVYVVTGRPKALDLAERLGFEAEGVLRHFGPEKEDMFILGKVRD